MGPGVWLTNFNSLFGEFNLQFLQICKSWENVFRELSYCIVVEIPKIENMINNEKPFLQPLKMYYFKFILHFWMFLVRLFHLCMHKIIA